MNSNPEPTPTRINGPSDPDLPPLSQARLSSVVGLLQQIERDPRANSTLLTTGRQGSQSLLLKSPYFADPEGRRLLITTLKLCEAAGHCSISQLSPEVCQEHRATCRELRDLRDCAPSFQFTPSGDLILTALTHCYFGGIYDDAQTEKIALATYLTDILRGRQDRIPYSLLVDTLHCIIDFDRIAEASMNQLPWRATLSRYGLHRVAYLKRVLVNARGINLKMGGWTLQEKRLRSPLPDQWEDRIRIIQEKLRERSFFVNTDQLQIAGDRIKLLRPVVEKLSEWVGVNPLAVYVVGSWLWQPHPQIARNRDMDLLVVVPNAAQGDTARVRRTFTHRFCADLPHSYDVSTVRLSQWMDARPYDRNVELHKIGAFGLGVPIAGCDLFSSESHQPPLANVLAFGDELLALARKQRGQLTHALTSLQSAPSSKLGTHLFFDSEATPRELRDAATTVHKFITRLVAAQAAFRRVSGMGNHNLFHHLSFELEYHQMRDMLGDLQGFDTILRYVEAERELAMIRTAWTIDLGIVLRLLKQRGITPTQ